MILILKGFGLQDWMSGTPWSSADAFVSYCSCATMTNWLTLMLWLGSASLLEHIKLITERDKLGDGKQPT